jgi:hypothetical protein
MLNRVCFAGLMIAMSAVPALADLSCGSAPLAPAIPGASELSGRTTDDAHQVALTALKSVKGYQGTLASYRECLKTQTVTVKAAFQEAQAKGEKDKAAQLQQQLVGLQSDWDKTIDTETQVVGDYMKLHDAYCKMGTGLAGCAK